MKFDLIIARILMAALTVVILLACLDQWTAITLPPFLSFETNRLLLWAAPAIILLGVYANWRKKSIATS